MFGTRLRTKVDVTLPLGETDNFASPREYCEVSRERDSLLFERVAAYTDSAREKMKRSYDRGTKVSEISSGNWVLVKDEARTDSLSPVYCGP